MNLLSAFDADAGIDGGDVVGIGEEGVDVYLLDLGGEAEQGGESHDDVCELALVDALLPARAFQHLVGAEAVDHRLCFGIGEGREAAGDIAQHFHEDASEAAEDDVAEVELVFGADEELGALEHLLHHHGGGAVDGHQTVVLGRQHFLAADVKGHAAHIALVYRAYNLGDHGVAAAVGEGDERLLVCRHHLRNHGDAGAGEDIANGLRRDVAIVLDAGDDLVEARDVNAVELHLGRCRLGRVHDL